MSDQQRYQEVIDELRTSGPIESLWVKCLVELNGDEKAAKVQYIKLRIEQKALKKNTQAFEGAAEKGRNGKSGFVKLVLNYWGILLALIVALAAFIILREGENLPSFIYSLF